MKFQMMRRIRLVAWITFKNSLRHKALYGILFMGLVLFCANVIFTGMFSWDMGKVAVDAGLSTVTFAGLILIFFFCINNMAGDIGDKTIYLILSRPVTKTEYILGKYAGLGLVIIISSTVLGICAFLSVWLSTAAVGVPTATNFSWLFFSISILLQTLSLLIILALALLWVMISSHQFTAVLLSLMTYFVGLNMENVKNIALSREMLSPDAFSVKVMDFASWVLPNLAAFDIKTAVAHGLEIKAGYIILAAAYGIFYTGICLCLSVIVFKKREI